MHQLANRLLIVGRNTVEHGLGAGIERLGHQRRGVGVANLPARRQLTRATSSVPSEIMPTRGAAWTFTLA